MPLKRIKAKTTQPSSWLPNLKFQENTERVLQLIEACVDDFIGMIQTDSIEKLQHFSRAILRGIYSVFPNGISKKKLSQEGM